MENTNKKSKKNNQKNKYVYNLMACSENEYDRTVGDYIFATDAKEAYAIAISICADLNKLYNINYTVQSIMPA